MSQVQESSPVRTGATASEQEGIQPGLADRAEAIKGIAQARKNLGHVAAGHEVHADASNVILTPREVEDLRLNGSAEDRHI